ncbi:hypothetical protein NZK33_03125 [Cyanobium sp. FGCU-6]|nr:hypothetical protein [Cyanobium sp. FGCU6]
MFFALLKEVIDEGGVLVLGDAIADRAGIARHLEVLAEGLGQRLTSGLRQGEDSLVGGLDLLGRERLQSDIAVNHWSRVLLLAGPRPSRCIENPDDCKAFDLCRLSLYRPSLLGQRNAQQHGQHPAGGLQQVVDLVGPLLAGDLCAAGVHHDDAQLVAAADVDQLGAEGNARGESWLGCFDHGSQIKGWNGLHLLLKGGQGGGERALGAAFFAEQLESVGWHACACGGLRHGN